MLVSMKEMLIKARKEGYAVIAPSTESEACMAAMVETAVECRSPLIINIRFDAFPEKDLPFYVDIARRRAQMADVPIAINLDHGSTYEQAIKAIHYGFTSVMVDYSRFPFDEHVSMIKEIIQVAHNCGVSVEAEFGQVGLGDINDTLRNNGQGHCAVETILTDPQQAAKFVELTGTDCLAVSIGNKHGAYVGEPYIDFERLEAIAAATDIPLVLHGGSGTGDENLARACRMGISKVNVGTELRTNAADFVRNAEVKVANFKGFKLMKEGYKEPIARHMKLYGSIGKAQS